MGERPYYSVRTGTNPHTKLNLPMLRRLFYQTFTAFSRKDFFQEAFGYWCVDNGDVPGLLGPDIEAFMLRKLRKANLWPIQDKYGQYSEDDVFDLLEFLYDCVSKPIEGFHHSYGDCGWHYSVFDREIGRLEYRKEINEFLRDYGEGFELSEIGEVCRAVPDDLQPVFDEPLPVGASPSVTDRIESAKAKYRRRGATVDDRRDAIRDLADAIEFLRPQLSGVMTRKDEGDLFNLANSFGIRHHDDRQKTDYDPDIWYDWMFFYYLNTINTVLRVIGREELVEPDDLPF